VTGEAADGRLCGSVGHLVCRRWSWSSRGEPELGAGGPDLALPLRLAGWGVAAPSLTALDVEERLAARRATG
jgi:hypothetical protein